MGVLCVSLLAVMNHHDLSASHEGAIHITDFHFILTSSPLPSVKFLLQCWCSVGQLINVIEEATDKLRFGLVSQGDNTEI